MEPLQWVDLTRSRPLGNVCYLRIDVKRTLRIELRMSPFGGKRPSNTATLAAEWRPWSLFSEVARFLQTGRTIEDPMTASYGVRWFEAEVTDDGNAQTAVIQPWQGEQRRLIAVLDRKD
jgi:hypothetical protein